MARAAGEIRFLPVRHAFMTNTIRTPALLPEPLFIRQTLSRQQVRLLRRPRLQLLPPSLHTPGPQTKSFLPTRLDGDSNSAATTAARVTTTTSSHCRLLLQGENVVGQQQSSLHPRLPALAEKGAWRTAHGRVVRDLAARGRAGWTGETYFGIGEKRV